jgi:lipopolysaccharide exporter
MLPKERVDAANIVGLTVIFSLLGSSVLLVIFLLLHDKILMLIGSRSLTNWLLLVPVAVLLQGLVFSLSYWNNRNKSFGVIAASKVTRGVAAPSSSMLFGLIDIKRYGLILVHLLGQVLDLLSLLRRAKIKAVVAMMSVRKMKEMAIRYIRFPIYAAPSNLLNATSLQLPNILLNRFFNETVVGFYSLAIRILNIPMTALGTAIGQVFFQKASELKNKPAALSELVRRTFLSLFYIGLVPMSLTLVFGDSIFAFVLGKEWAIAGRYGMVLSVWLLLVFMGSPISNLIDLLEKQKAGLIFNSIMMVIRIGTLFAGFLIFRDAYMTIAVFGIAGAALWIIFISYLLLIAGVNIIKTLSRVIIIFCSFTAFLYFLKFMI